MEFKLNKRERKLGKHEKSAEKREDEMRWQQKILDEDKTKLLRDKANLRGTERNFSRRKEIRHAHQVTGCCVVSRIGWPL